MKARLQALARRVDALSLRERVFLFLSAAIVMVALADTFFITPQLALQREGAAGLARQNTELAQLRSQLAVATMPASAASPAGQLQAALRAARQERQALEQALQALAPAPGAAPPRLAELLARVLRRHEGPQGGLSLVRLEVAAAQAGSAPGRQAVPEAGMQEVDLALDGSYLALAAYLAEIEAALPGLRWGPMTLEAREPGPATPPGAGPAAPSTAAGGPVGLLSLRVWLPAERSGSERP